MHISKQKKLTYRIGAPVVLASMMFLAEGAHGFDQVERIATEHYGNLMKEREIVYAEEKRTLVQELTQQKEEMKLTELNLKSVIGGAEDAPIVEEVKKLVEIVKGEDAATLEEALGSLNENLQGVPGPTLVGKVEALKETLAVTLEEKGVLEQKIKEKTGGNGTGTPILTRLDGWRNSSDTIEVLKQKLAVPGDELVEKVNNVVAEGELAKKERELAEKKLRKAKKRLRSMKQDIIAKDETINGLKESLEDILENVEDTIIAKEETIIDKEETINVLHVELLVAQTEIKSLYEQLSPREAAPFRAHQVDQLLAEQCQILDND